MNTEQPSPSQLAQQALQTLSERQLPPTPENYALIYQELTGNAASQPADWSELIRQLLQELDINRKGISLSRKKESIQFVLQRFSKKPEQLPEKLQNLLNSWQLPLNSSAAEDMALVETTADKATTTATLPAAPQEAPIEHPASADMIGNVSELLAQTLESIVTTQPDLGHEIQAFAQQARSIENNAQITSLAKQLRPFWIKVELRGGDKSRIHEGLIHLLRLLVENISEMIEDEEWLRGQINILQQIIANPIDKAAITDAEQNLRNAITQQGMLKQSMSEAKTTLKGLMSTFIDRLGEITSSTGDYKNKIAGYSLKIKASDNLPDLNSLLEDIMLDTNIVHKSAVESHEDMLNTQQRTHEAEEKIKHLEKELADVSKLVHQDQLTGALNRRGLNEAFDRETKRSERNHKTICIALLDIDNFKRLNDTLGHHAGDKALQHLSQLVQETLRPSDYVARYGGEEFVILLPDIDLDAAAATIARVQRELTKHFFLYDKDKVLITFSAGVAEYHNDETRDDVIGRADKAMYQAKKSGKNRVIIAE